MDSTIGKTVFQLIEELRQRMFASNRRIAAVAAGSLFVAYMLTKRLGRKKYLLPPGKLVCNTLYLC